MYEESDDIYRLNAAYTFAVIAGVLWLLLSALMAILAFGWGNWIGYTGPWDYIENPHLPDPSYFTPARYLASVLLATGLVYLVLSTFVYKWLRGRLDLDMQSGAVVIPLAMIVPPIVMVLSLCAIMPWWLHTYTD
jgi:hypothetical protein